MQSTIFINNKSYLIKEVLGQGSFGIVYKAEDQSNRNAVAIKLQNYMSQNELELLEKFKGKNFKNLVNIYDIQIHQNYTSIIMELGLISLQDKIQKSKILPKEARYVMQQICNGILELHTLGFAHRDLKPENILIFTLQDQGQTQEIYKICDYGTSKDFQNIKTPCVGTPYYLAPEQLNPNFPINQQMNYNQSIDIWAFGAVMYELFTNTPLFNGKTIQEIYEKIKNLPIELEIRKLQQLEDKYKDLLIKMLQRNPQNRIEIQVIKKELSQISSQNLVKKQDQPIQIQKINQPGNSQFQSMFQRGRIMNIKNPQQSNINPPIMQQQGNKFIELQKIAQPATLQRPLFQLNNNGQTIQHQFNQQQNSFQDNNQVRHRSIHKDQQQVPRQMFLSPPPKR